MRVLHVVVAGEVGGAERLLCELASRPAETRAEHTVALFTPNAELAALFARRGLAVCDRGRVRENAATFVWRSLGSRDVGWLVAVAQDARADVLHLHTFASQVIGVRAARRVGARVVRTEHSTRVFDDPSCWPFARWSLRHADVSIAVSEHVRAVASTKAPWCAARMVVVRNGVNVSRAAGEPSSSVGSFLVGLAPSSAAVPARNPEVFTFVLVARLEPRKGVDLALSALARVPNARLEVVGEGRKRVRLEARARSLGISGRVVFHGHLRDPRWVVSSAQAALCSSRSEGLGLANLEAMALGRAVVGFAVGGVPEVVEHDVTGLLAPAGDVEALAACMRQATQDPGAMERRGHAARAFVERSCTIEAMCRAYADVYESAGARRRTSAGARR